MGRASSLLKSLASQISLSSPLGQLLQVMATSVDQTVSAGQVVWSCPSTVSVNDLVYISGANAVDLANGAPASTANPAIGFVVSKPTPTSCVVQASGLLPNRFADLQPGVVYYMGLTPGHIVPAGTVFPGGSTLQQVGIAKSTTELIAGILAAV